MSWWPLPDSEEDVTGDPAVDAVDGALVGLAERRASHGEAKPSLAEVAGALQTGLAILADRFEDAKPRPAVRVVGCERAESVPPDVTEAVCGALIELAEAYEQELGRQPRVAEALYAFTFSFGGRPERRVDGPVPVRIEFRS